MSPIAYRSVNPATGEVLKTYDFLTDSAVDDALAASYDAHREWKEQSPKERAAVLARAAELFVERRDELGEIAALEMGKPLAEAVDEVDFAASILEYFAKQGPDFLQEKPLDIATDTDSAVVQKLAIGPVLGIMPWNFPFYQVARFIGPNLILGNTVLLKHAETVPQSAAAIETLLADAGLPKGVYQNLYVSHTQIEHIIGDPRVQGVSLTGSERAGAAVAAIAGRSLKKVVLELGGNDAYIILDTDDAKAAAIEAWENRNYNTGQACNSNKRLIVAEDIFDEFVETLAGQARGMKPGDPLNLGEGEFAPLSSRAAAERLHEQISDAVSKGATLHAGGVISSGADAYFSPAVLTGVTEEMRAFREELFGPVAVVYSVSSDAEAIDLANNSDYGLGGAVFSTDRERAKRVASQLETGMANVNTWAGEGAEVPFGGTKRSGFGRELGPEAVDEFANKRLFYVQDAHA